MQTNSTKQAIKRSKQRKAYNEEQKPEKANKQRHIDKRQWLAN